MQTVLRPVLCRWNVLGLKGRFLMTTLALGLFGTTFQCWALDLDWSGQFRAESHWVFNYAMDAANLTPDSNRMSLDESRGYYIPGGGNKNANFQTLFLRLTPTVIVNDNVYIKSEWWVGDPLFGFFGNGTPYTLDQRQYYSNQSRGSFIQAQRYWAEVLTDVGTVQAGRLPLHWGLGVVWNSGNELFDRYQSTGDAVRLISKFGSFSFVPSIIHYSMGTNFAGGCQNATCTSVSGGAGGVSEYSLAVKYENLDEDIEMGLNFLRKIAGSAQPPNAGLVGLDGQATGMSFNTWDIYGRKKLGRFTFAGELPVATGKIGGVDYSTWAVALESKAELSDHWEFGAKVGRVPGQPPSSTSNPTDYRVFYLHPNYRLGLIMFQYQLANFYLPKNQNDPTTNASSLKSAFDNPISNASYLSLGGKLKLQKWSFHTLWTFAKAEQVARSGDYHFNTWKRKYESQLAPKNQSDSLGWEMDYGLLYQWDEAFRFGIDIGFYFPGDFYKFSNTATDNQTSMIFASVFRMGIVF